MFLQNMAFLSLFERINMLIIRDAGMSQNIYLVLCV